MINAKELRIGNLVEYKITDKFDDRKEWWEVSETDADDIHWLSKVDAKDEDFRPIKLTEEWLLKLGFELLYTGKFRKVYDFSKDLRFGYSDNHGLSNTQSAVTFVGNYFTHIKYVHEFQNLYFALTGSELTVA